MAPDCQIGRRQLMILGGGLLLGAAGCSTPSTGPQAKRTAFSIDVSVIRSGHPTYVFGTNRLSDHPRGRAFDTWRIDGHPVVDPATSKKLITTYMQAAVAAGSYNVGGPYQLSGQGTSYFTDATHHDHVHAGFRS
jgi:hypothetical protein